MSKYTISSKMIARDLDRNQEPKNKSFFPGKLTLVVLINVLLWISIFAIITSLDLL